MSKDFGKTWWGELWLRSLSHIDFGNRLPRGARYARNGSVREIILSGNNISAKVAGSRPSPYKVTIVVPPFSPEEKRRLLEQIVGRPALISKLLNRILDPELLTISE